MDNKKEKKICFSEEIDNEINSYAVIFTFILLGLLLQFFPSIFGSVDKYISIIFIAFGIIALISEVNKKIINHNLKGFDDILISVVIGAILIFARMKISIPWLLLREILKIIYILLFMVVIFGAISGILKVFYSCYVSLKNVKKKSKKKVFSSIFKIIIDLFGLVLVILQIIELISK